MKKRGVFIAWALILVLFAGLITLLLFWKETQKKNGENYNLYGLPILEISLNEEVSLSEIQENGKELKYGNNSVAFYNGGEISYFGDTIVKGRGNSTWLQEKKPYQLDLNQKADLLGLGKRSKWVLIANYLDESHLRNDMALYLSRMLGEKFALDGEPVELTVDGENLGLYFLTPKINIGKNSIDLRDELGVVMELDNFNVDCSVEKCYLSTEENTLVVKDVVNEANIEMAANDFMQSYNELETVASAGDFDKVKELIDVESFAQYFLVSEFSNNPDAYSTSWFMYKDGANDKIHAGPTWDFDFAFGNQSWGQWPVADGSSPENSTVRRIEAFGGEYTDVNGETRAVEQSITIARLMYYLMDMPEFYNEVKRVYQDKMAGHKSEFLSYLKKRADHIFVAAVEDNAMWERGDFTEAVAYLYDWTARRYDYFESVYGDGNAEKITQEL